MATSIQIAEVRNNIGEAADAEPWTDAYITALIDAYGVNEASAKSWEQKAAAIADMTDISEAGSSRKSAHSQYLEMAKRFRENVVQEDSTLRAPRTREAVRQ